jgi:hypothetical protein
MDRDKGEAGEERVILRHLSDDDSARAGRGGEENHQKGYHHAPPKVSKGHWISSCTALRTGISSGHEQQVGDIDRPPT